MSRKSVQISIPPASGAPAVPTRIPAGKPAGLDRMGVDRMGVDSWVAQAAEAMGEEALASRPLPDGGLTVKVRLTAEPDWSEAAKIFFFLPQAAMWFWSFGMARRFMRGPYNWRF